MNLSGGRRDFLHIGLFGLGYLLLALMVSNSYYQLIMTIVPIWAIMGLSWNLFSGYSGSVLVTLPFLDWALTLLHCVWWCGT
jgi:ABC-type branched-subunit amino acid transport system permease subunit